MTEQEKRIIEAMYQAVGCVKTCGAHLPKEDLPVYLGRVRDRLKEMMEDLRDLPTDLKE